MTSSTFQLVKIQALKRKKQRLSPLYDQQRTFLTPQGLKKMRFPATGPNPQAALKLLKQPIHLPNQQEHAVLRRDRARMVRLLAPALNLFRA